MSVSQFSNSKKYQKDASALNKSEASPNTNVIGAKNHSYQNALSQYTFPIASSRILNPTPIYVDWPKPESQSKKSYCSKQNQLRKDSSFDIIEGKPLNLASSKILTPIRTRDSSPVYFGNMSVCVSKKSYNTHKVKTSGKMDKLASDQFLRKKTIDENLRSVKKFTDKKYSSANNSQTGIENETLYPNEINMFNTHTYKLKNTIRIGKRSPDASYHCTDSPGRNTTSCDIRRVNSLIKKKMDFYTVKNQSQAFYKCKPIQQDTRIDTETKERIKDSIKANWLNKANMVSHTKKVSTQDNKYSISKRVGGGLLRTTTKNVFVSN